MFAFLPIYKPNHATLRLAPNNNNCNNNCNNNNNNKYIQQYQKQTTPTILNTFTLCCQLILNALISCTNMLRMYFLLFFFFGFWFLYFVIFVFCILYFFGNCNEWGSRQNASRDTRFAGVFRGFHLILVGVFAQEKIFAIYICITYMYKYVLKNVLAHVRLLRGKFNC